MVRERRSAIVGATHMVDSRKRATASLKVKYKSATLGQFTQQFGLDISHGGIFIKTKSALEPGALIRLELQLSDATPVIQGSGRVKWRRVPAPESALPAGMGIEFIRLEASSRALVDRIVDAREGRPSRFEQIDGAEVLNSSQPLSALISSVPPRPAGSLGPPGIAPAPAGIPDAPPPAGASAVRAATPPPSGDASASASGLFTTSSLRPLTLMPGPESPQQSSFFPSIRPSAVPATPASAPAPTAPPPLPVQANALDEAITREFPEHALFNDEGAITSQHSAGQSAGDDRFAEDSAITSQHVAPTQEGAITAHQDPPGSWEVPPLPSGASPLTLGLSSLQPPPHARSTTLVWVIVLALTLLAGAFAFHYLRRVEPAAGQLQSPSSLSLRRS